MASYHFAQALFLKALGTIYFIAFLNVLSQFRALLGEKGLLPVGDFVQRVPVEKNPTIFAFFYKDWFLMACAWVGLLFSILAISGVSEEYGFPLHILTWVVLWGLYLSYVNIGQIFYGFGWESLLLETGFLAIFMSPYYMEASLIMMWLVRWLLFRVMFGAGMIKLRGDPCWKDYTCLYYHYETQPMPNPLSWYFHYLPLWVHRSGVAFNHFVEVALPFLLFIPGPVGATAGALTAAFQFMLILSGNLSWLNYITIVLCIPCIDDSVWKYFFDLPKGPFQPVEGMYFYIVIALAVCVAYLSINIVKNLISPNQVMNTSYDRWHLVNTYGAFGGITRVRHEIILEGTHGDPDDSDTQWQEYEFVGKPGKLDRCPPQIAPYHLRLDWLMWFAAMGSYKRHPWIVHLIAKLLMDEKIVVKLLRDNPFENNPPKYIRALLYRYKFTPWNSPSSDWWEREYVGEYLPALSLEDERLTRFCRSYGWL